METKDYSVVIDYYKIIIIYEIIYYSKNTLLNVFGNIFITNK